MLAIWVKVRVKPDQKKRFLEAIEIDATVAEETDDVVRIMTMHGAKGLEYPIVALALVEQNAIAWS